MSEIDINKIKNILPSKLIKGLIENQGGKITSRQIIGICKYLDFQQETLFSTFNLVEKRIVLLEKKLLDK